jgi:ATP-binding cassette subfamily B protein
VLAGAAGIAALALLARLVRLESTARGPTAGGLVWAGLAWMGLVVLAREAFQLVSRYLVQRVGAGLGKELTVAVADRQHRADLTSLASEPVGARVARLTGGVEGLVRWLRMTFLEALPAACTLLFALAYALVTQSWIGLLLLGFVPGALWLGLRQMEGGRDAQAELLARRDRVEGALTEQLAGVEYLRAANAEGREVDRVAGLLEDWRRLQLRQYLRSILFGSLRVMSGWAFQFAVIAVAACLAGLGKMAVADIAVYGNLFFSVYVPLWRIHYALEDAQEKGPRIDDLLAALAEPTDRSLVPEATGSSAQPTFGPGRPLFEVKDLVVEYRGPLGTKRALDGVSVRIDCGEVVGIAGRSGSGKSTLVKALLRLAHPSSGRALLGGVPLESVPRRELARLAGYVGQEPFLFSGTVAQNIAYGRPEASPAEVRRAAKLVGLHRDIVRLPGGYQAPVGERGRALSGGQRQRLALARALLSGPPVLVLDEATSALDPASERRVLRALARGRGERTVLLVAHRPAALRAADRVLVFDQGKLVEQGGYRDLLRQGGTFAKMIGEGAARSAAHVT